VFLVFNHLLERASRQYFGGSLEAQRWEMWFRATFKRITDRSVPRNAPSDNGYRKIDWDGVQGIIQNSPRQRKMLHPFLVIDEGQDMPPQFYNALIDLGFKHLFVVADQNQQIFEYNSSREQIQDCLAVDSADVFELRRNFRNRYPVARLARTFYTGDPASLPPEIPAHDRSSAPVLYCYDGTTLSTVANYILSYAAQRHRHLIGIIAPNNTVRINYLQALRTAAMQLGSRRPRVVSFAGKYRPNVSFDESGILVINAQACKGLEFDTVVLADIDEHYFRRTDAAITRRLFFVMVARAKYKVFMFMKRGGRNDIESILPTDKNVLRRKEL
jgi:DNA helicase IV